MEEQTDKSFMKSLSMVVLGLVVFGFAMVFISRSFNLTGNANNNPSQMKFSEERIKPVADAYTSAAGVAAAAPAIASAAPAPAVAFDGSLDGEKIFGNVCAACHLTGAAGAPKPGSEEMSKRAEKGPEALLQTAINGLNAMPPRGGRPDLSDEQLKAVIAFMTK